MLPHVVHPEHYDTAFSFGPACFNEHHCFGRVKEEMIQRHEPGVHHLQIHKMFEDFVTRMEQIAGLPRCVFSVHESGD